MSTRRRWWRRGSEKDFADEVASHLELEVDRLVSEGFSPEEARDAARRAFGNVTRARERYRESRPTVGLEQVVQDLRYAARGLRQSLPFTATVVLTLAIGLGLVTVVFAVFNAYFLRPFAVQDPFSLYSVSWRSQEAGGSTFRWRDYQLFKERHELFDGVVAETTRQVLSDGRPISINFVSGNYFDVLGPRIALGRGLLADDARTPGSEPVAVLTDQAWARLFGRDRSVLGQTIDANGIKLTIVGVMAPEFSGLDDVPRDVWTPMTMHDALFGGRLFAPNDARPLRVTAHLRPGVRPEQAQAALSIEPFATRVAGRIDAVRANLQIQATPVRLTRQGFAFLSPVFAAFGLVLVAAAANASNVMLARANARHREIGIRLSIGASRGRIVRQLLTEGVLIASLAGFAGLALAGGLLRLGRFLFVAMLPATIAARVRFVSFDFDARVFVFAFAVAAAAMIVFALLPALQATRLSLTDALRGQATGAIRNSTMQNLLVTSQVAVSLLLLIVAATLVRNATAIRTTDLGLQTEHVISVRPGRNDPALIGPTYAALTTDGHFGEPVVASRSPLFGETMKIPIRQKGGLVVVSCTFVSPRYFEMLGIQIVHGRGFLPGEAAAEAPVTIVSEAGARTLWPGEDPIGKAIRVRVEPPETRTRVADTVSSLRRIDDAADGPDSRMVTVVGVAADVVSGFVYQGKDPAHLYLPTSPSGTRALALLVRPADARLGAVRLKDVLQRVQSDPLAFDVLPLSEMVALQQFPIRAASWVGTLLSGIALALSISGLYGVLTYMFGQRTREIGIRMALGATDTAVTRLVVLQSARLAAYGTAIGLLFGFGVMKLLSTVVRLDNVSVIDPGAFAVSVVLIAVAVGVASLGPARRAVRVDPTTMLRADG